LNYRFSYSRYQRQFRQALATSHGEWSVREGIIIRLQASHHDIYWGEIAPIPWFESETISAAEDFCQSLAGWWTEDIKIPNHLPACQFAWSAALKYGRNWKMDGGVKRSIYRSIDPHWSVLLPAGRPALTSWQTFWQQGQRTFKWKIGVNETSRELEILHELVAMLPVGAKLRLDANGGLSYEQASIWLEQCDRLSCLEFLEQPLLDLQDMLKLADRYQTPLALDESVSNLARLQSCYQQGWRGIFVIKPAIAGRLDQLADFIHQHQLDVVCSTSIESPLGQSAIVQWAQDHGCDRRALGMGVQHWFTDDFDPTKCAEFSD
jgi:o-succinylbenzoate synthase